MNTSEERLQALFEEGNTYTYENFSTKGEYGYPSAFNEAYSSWKLRSRMTIEKVFGPNSDILSYFDKGSLVRVLGNGNDHFSRAQKYMLGALTTAIDTLKFDSHLIEKEISNNSKPQNTKVFIVHGHDDALKKDVEIFLGEIGLEPIVLHRQADEGKTIIEKFEKHSDVGYAFVLLTPDDIAYHASQDKIEESKRIKYYRARQNVIFEFGYFVGKLGRNRVCCIHKEDIEIPSDISGLIYKKISSSLDEVAYQIIKDLRAVGYSLKL